MDHVAFLNAFIAGEAINVFEMSASVCACIIHEVLINLLAC